MVLRPLNRFIAGMAMVLATLAGSATASAPSFQPSRAWGSYAFKSYGGDQGLTTLAVTELTQDQRDFIWVGTEDGLFRYDGDSFRRFGVEQGLPDPNILGLAPAPDGSLWVLTQKGLAHVKGDQISVMAPATGLPRPEDLVPFASAMACDSQSRLWIATLKGLYEGGPSGFWPVQGLPHGVPTVVRVDPDGSLLVALTNGQILCKPSSGQWEQARLPIPYDKAIIRGLARDTEGRIWARGEGFLFRYDQGLKGNPKNLSASYSLKALRSPSLFADQDGRVWVPTETGVIVFQGEGSFLLDESWGLPDTWVGSVLVDREGNLWVGSEGIHRILGRLLWTSITRRQGLPSDTLWAVARTGDGRVWAGTQAGLAVGDASGWRSIPELKGQAITVLCPDGSFGLWAGATRPGTKKGALLHVLPGGRNAWVDLPGMGDGDQLQGLSRAEDGTLWGVSQTGKLWKMPPVGPPLPVPIPGLEPRTNPFMILARNNAVFLSTDHGLAILDQGTWKLLGLKDGLKSTNTQALAMNAAGELWLSYADKHDLTLLSRTNGVWGVSGAMTETAVIEDSIVSMAFDADGHLWLGTSRGVKRWDGHTCIRFGRGDGLPGEDADGNAIWVDAEGAWFGMSNGLAHYDLQANAGPIPPPSAQIMKAVDGGGHALEAEDHLLLIPYAFRTMDFEVAIPSYTNENHVRFQVRLQGFEDQWRDTKSRDVRYTALPPGDYRFEARAAIGAGGAFGTPDTLSFRVLTPWWRSWWFYALCFVLISALVLASVRWRTAVLEHRNRDLESLIRARTMDLERANEQLKESSMVDTLTGLKNRRYLNMSLPEEEGRVLRAFRTIQSTGLRPTGEDLVFLLVDLDHFKIVNDTHGHAVGDVILRLVAEAIREATRDTDTVARWGGEEFLVVARRSDRDTADVIARKILEEVRGRLYPIGNGHELRLTCSVGFSAFPVVTGQPGAFGWEEVVEIADQCLYAAKRTGRDAYVGVYMDEIEVAPEIIQRLISDLPALVSEKKVVLKTSFRGNRKLHWKEGH